MNTCTASGIAARTWRAPWTSISSTTGTPRCDAALELRAQRPVAAPGVVGVLDELARRDQLVETLAGEEVVVDAVALARAGARGWWPTPTARARGAVRAGPGSACPCRPPMVP